MPATGDGPHELLLAHLDFIRHKVEQLCRRHRASPEVAEELFGDLEVKLLENDCEVLRRYRGEAKLTTYLTVVIARFFVDWTARQWGTWRPPAAAREVSAGAQEVEQLIGRDGFSRDEALRIVASRTARGAGELRRLDESVGPAPARWRPRLVGLEAAETVASPSTPSPEEALCAGEAQRELDAELSRALAALAGQDRLLVRLRFGSGLTVAAIARTLGLRQRELYTRIERALRRLRDDLLSSGLSQRDVREHLTRMERLPDLSAPPPPRPAERPPLPRRRQRAGLRAVPREPEDEDTAAPHSGGDAMRSGA